LENGYVSYIVENRDKAIEKALDIAKLVAEKSPVAVQGTKVLLDYSRDHSVREGISCYFLDLILGLDYTRLWNSIHLQTNVCSFSFL
jgi:Delta3,5-Delta2,4-dienoyl-CoA isomerase